MAKAPKKADSLPKRGKLKRRVASPKDEGTPENRDSSLRSSGPPGLDQVSQEALPSAPEDPGPLAGPEVLDRLWTTVDGRKGIDPRISHSARLLARGKARIAQKLGEEAVECVVEIVTGSREGLIGESADVLYHLLVAWVDAGIRPGEVWRELCRREQLSVLRAGAGRKRTSRRVISRTQRETAKIP